MSLGLKEVNNMFIIGMFIVLMVCLLAFIVGNAIGNKRIKQQEKEIELIQLQNDLEKERLKNELTHKKELQQVGEKLISDEKYYMNGLQEEISRIEKNLSDLELKQVPTREQLDTWLFMMKAENAISNQQASEIMRLYDVKRIYPESKV